MNFPWRLALSSAVVAALCACPAGGPAVCDKADSIDLTKKAGDCAGLDLSKPYGDKATCTSKVKPCSQAEQATLQSMLVCLDNLAVCSAAKKDTFLSGQASCFSGANGLTEACRVSVFGNVIPHQDAGMLDAGPPVDAGRQPAPSGGSALDFIAVADESGFAFAWSARQPAAVFQWELNTFDLSGDGGRLPEIYLTPGTTRVFEQAGQGVRRYYLAGVDVNKLQIYGDAPDAGPVVVDAGMTCMRATDCPPDRVCDLGQCKEQKCQSGGASTCPAGYNCLPANMNCVRAFSDAGTLDAGMAPDAGGVFVTLPILSEAVVVATGKPGLRDGGTYEFPTYSVGNFAALHPSLIAVDSARQFVSVEQANAPFGHLTTRRGQELVDDFGTTSSIDTVGTRVRLAYVAQSDTVFACYNVGRGVRVRRSRDLGKTWGSDAVTLDPTDDGGFSSRFTDCAIGAWKNGGAILAYVEDDAIAVRTVSETLAISDPPEYVFQSSPTDGGGANVYQPTHTTIATLPGALADGGIGSIVQIGFTATRVSGSGADTEVYGLYRDGTTGTFLPAKVINDKGDHMGTVLAQDNVTIAIDPFGRSVAAYVSAESGPSGPYNTIYTSLFVRSSNPQLDHTWITGSDLTVFAKDVTGTNFYVFPARAAADVWDAFSPSLAVTKAGKIFLGIVAGKRAGGGNDFRMYMTGFDFAAQSPIGGKGWFVPPALKLSDTRVRDPRPSNNVIPFNTAVIAADSQLSVYGVFIEGIGQFGEIENRAIYVSRP